MIFNAFRFAALAALTTVAAGSALADPISAIPGLQLNPVSCVFQGQPSEFPDDVRILNKSSQPLAAGVRIRWTLADTGETGIVTLAAPLAAGATAWFPNVLSRGVEPSRACRAALVVRGR